MKIKLSGSLILVSIVFLTLKLAAQDEQGQGPSVKVDAYAGQSNMNGYALKDFSDFYKQWRLVSVRYREDSKEMRFTYANPMAAKALDDHTAEFPDGAIFAKIGFVTEKDPIFTSSIVPSGAKRYQFMVHDKAKFATTDGWGYALFNGDGKTFNGNPHDNAKACAACHSLAASRGYVFSQQAAFPPFVEKVAEKMALKTDLSRSVAPNLRFVTVKIRELDPRVRRLLPARFSQARALKGILEENIFDGTINEVGPLLSGESAHAAQPAVLIGPGSNLFALAYPEAEAGKCAKPKVTTVIARTVASNRVDNGSDETVVKIASFCYDPR